MCLPHVAVDIVLCVDCVIRVVAACVVHVHSADRVDVGMHVGRICVSTCKRICMKACMHVYMYVCMHVCMCVCIYACT